MTTDTHKTAMNEKIKVYRRFDSDKHFFAGRWDVASRVVFSASANAENADKAEEECLKRAMRFHKRHADTHVVLYRLENAFGGSYTHIHIHVRKNNCERPLGKSARIIVPSN